jgi:hypothetical protein
MDQNQSSTEVVTKTAQGGQLDAAVPIVPPEPPGLDLTRHESVATQFINGLHALTALLEGFGRAKKGHRTTIANYASIPDEAYEVVVRGLEFSPGFAAAVQLTPDEVRDAMALTKAYVSIRGELEVVMQAVEDTIAEKRAVTGERCARAVKIGDQLTLKGEAQDSVLHLRQMLAVFKLRRRRTPEETRALVKSMKTIRRKTAAAVDIQLTGNQLPMEPVTAKFKAGRDIES